MADTDIWNLGALLARGATDRIPVASAAGAGGYHELSSFLFKNGAGTYYGYGGANYALNLTSPKADFSVELNAVDNAAGVGLRYSSASGGQGPLKILNAAGEVARFDAVGNFGIGTTSPARPIHIARGDQGDARIRIQNTAVGGQAWELLAGIHNAAQTNFSIHCATTLVDALTITSGGSLGIGTIQPQVRFHVKSTSEIVRLETSTARGGGSCWATFYDPTGRKGVLGYGSSDDTFNLMNEMNAGIIFGTNNTNRWQLAASGHFYPQTDNAYSLGASSARVTVVYAATGTINTSDEREKKWRGRITDAELAAGLAVLDELGFYQWLSDIDRKKGTDDEARFHFGVRAQEVWRIFAAQKLVAPIKRGKPGRTPYAFLCWDQWGDEFEPIMAEKKVRKTRPVMVESKVLGPDGSPVMVEKSERYTEIERVDTGKKRQTKVAGDRFGIRPDQLALFLVACIDERSRREKAAADIRIEALEAAIAELKAA